MSKTKRIFFGSLMLACFCVAVVALQGCGVNPVAPSSPGGDMQRSVAAMEFVDSLLAGPVETGLAAGSDLDSYRNSPYYVDDQSSKAVFDDKGGELKLKLDGEEIVFVVPEKAVKKHVEIAIRGFKFNTPNGIVFQYECAPEGLHFKSPIRLRQPVSSGRSAEINLLYRDSSTGWVLEESAKVNGDHAEFEIHHFSKYGLSF